MNRQEARNSLQEMDDKQPEVLMIDPAKGYVPGNIETVSRKAFRIVEFLRAEELTREQFREIERRVFPLLERENNGKPLEGHHLPGEQTEADSLAG